jgi:hypothetical protein
VWTSIARWSKIAATWLIAWQLFLPPEPVFRCWLGKLRSNDRTPELRLQMPSPNSIGRRVSPERRYLQRNHPYDQEITNA